MLAIARSRATAALRAARGARAIEREGGAATATATARARSSDGADADADADGDDVDDDDDDARRRARARGGRRGRDGVEAGERGERDARGRATGAVESRSVVLPGTELRAERFSGADGENGAGATHGGGEDGEESDAREGGGGDAARTRGVRRREVFDAVRERYGEDLPEATVRGEREGAAEDRARDQNGAADGDLAVHVSSSAVSTQPRDVTRRDATYAVASCSVTHATRSHRARREL